MNARQHQHFVVHGESKDDAEHDDGIPGVNGLGGEVEQVSTVAPLENPHQHTKGSGDGKDVHGDGFEGNDHRANLHENQEGCGDENEGQGSGKVVGDGLEVVSVVGRKSSDEKTVVFAR